MDGFSRFFKISGVNEIYIKHAMDYLKAGDIYSSDSFYNGQDKRSREKHLSMLMLKKYMTLITGDGNGDEILTWWEKLKTVDPRLKGDFHIHSVYSDGMGTIGELAEIAEKIGYDWIVIADHSPADENPLRLDEEKFKKRHDDIAAINDRGGLQVYESIEADIYDEGVLLVPDKWRDFLDFIVVSLHEEITDYRKALKRIERVLEDPLVKVFAHPFYGLKKEFENIYIDGLLDIIERAGKAVEFNMAPQFLVSNYILAEKCRNKKLSAAFSTDSHFTENLNHMRFASLYYPEYLSGSVLNSEKSITV